MPLQLDLDVRNLEQAPFGSVFTRKMAVSHYRDGAWAACEIEDTQALTLHPAAHVFHYASTCFEGLKAYRWADGSVRVFRLDRHIERMLGSAHMLCLPEPEAGSLQQMIISLVDECRDEIPEPPGSLYIRPTLIGTQPNIGAAATASSEACLYVLLSPVGDYFQGGARALKILIETEHLRSTPDFGMAKTGGNYASALRHVIDARERYGADQVLFCPQGDVQETGATNFLLLNDKELMTKPLDTSYLHGVTRDSLLTLAASLGYRVTEASFTVDELLEWIGNGEAALSGTAAVLTGVGSFVYQDQEYRVLDGNAGPNTERLRQALTDIQTGKAPDCFGWLRRV